MFALYTHLDIIDTREDNHSLIINMDTIKRKKTIQEEVQYTTRWEVAKEIGAGILLIATIVGVWLLIVILF